ncbi:hypothetical protein DPMN_143119 [Dreissena polymorpha]|uniref:Uncharacterized protein n=1 Tax=Dreissena polymorpha TaxID=45954 RepID=A0A9D4GCI1_DREPO|nr:hypothetical protein DPMN_143119 [Dreissena polymorpha]
MFYADSAPCLLLQGRMVRARFKVPRRLQYLLVSQRVRSMYGKRLHRRAVLLQGTMQARFSGISSCPAIAVVGTLASHLGDPGSIPLPVASASWTIEVTLHVFSGTPDPEYVIPRNTKSYDVILKAIGDTSTPLGERLGYNGFTVTLIREASRWTVGWCTRPVVELRILAAVSAMTPSGHQHPLQAGVIDYVKESILSCKG